VERSIIPPELVAKEGFAKAGPMIKVLHIKVKPMMTTYALIVVFLT
jgi:hypothetical protein